MLKKAHPVEGDEEISFDAESHVYTVRGAPVPISVTKVIETHAIPEEHRFDGPAVIKRNLKRWREGSSSQYREILAGTNDEEGMQIVQQHWAETAAKGTAMHALFEDALNGVWRDATGYESEMEQFRDAMVSIRKQMTPVRTELSVFVNGSDGKAAVAGQIDLLAVHQRTGVYHLIDFKRTPKDLRPEAFAYGKTFCKNKLPLNDYHKYSLQLSMYAVMLKAQTGYDVAARGHILQIHPQLEGAQCIEAADLQEEARELLKRVGAVVNSHTSE